MRCAECPHCRKGFFESKPEAWVCTGVKNPFVIDDINHECTEYSELRKVRSDLPEFWDEENKEIVTAETIKDSGSTTEFDTGAHRDAREGKGRCDLIPLEVMSKYIGDDGTDLVLDCIADFQKTNNTKHLYDALACFDEDHWDNCYTMMLEVAKHYEAGAKHYGENNWKRGMPTYIYIDSAIRHYLKWLRGDTDERHDTAFVWNVMCCIWEVDYHEKKENIE